MMNGRAMNVFREEFLVWLSGQLKTYPSLGEGLKLLVEPSSTNLAELLRLSTKCKVYSFVIEQRGKHYIVSRGSSVRGTHGYESFSYHLSKDDTPTNVEDHPQMTIRLILKCLNDAEIFETK